MTGQPEASGEVRAALAGAYGAAAGGSRDRGSRQPVVGTEHLLAGLAFPFGEACEPNRGHVHSGTAARLLDEAQLTHTVVMAMLRRRTRGRVGWQTDEPPDPRPDGPDWCRAGKQVNYSGAARAALDRAGALAATSPGHAVLDTDDVLRSLLAVDDNRAVELVRASGVDPARLRDRLAGDASAPVVDDPLPPELEPTRDALLGRTGYGGSGGLRSLLYRTFAATLVEVPAAWVTFEAHEQVRRLGQRRLGTEHLLLAVLATHETLRQFPHLRSDEERRYAGGEALADAGVTYRGAVEAARDAGEDGLGTDARRATSYRLSRWRTRVTPPGTGELLLAVLTQDDCRAANLLRRTGVAPAEIRARLRA